MPSHYYGHPTQLWLVVGPAIQSRSHRWRCHRAHPSCRWPNAALTHPNEHRPSIVLNDFIDLATLRADTNATATAQRAALQWSHPHPRTLLELAGSPRMWERRPSDHDFCHVRVGVGTHRLATRLTAPETGPPEDLEPVSTVALRRFVAMHSIVHALPTATVP